MSNDWQRDILEFSRAVGAYVEVKPTLPPRPVQGFRYDLIKEEMSEALTAISDGDIVKIADGIGDSIVVLLGTAIAYGIDMHPIWDEIHRTNMLKTNGPVRFDGKRLKPDNWTPPRIAELLAAQVKEVS